jgi:hypothetical protein
MDENVNGRFARPAWKVGAVLAIAVVALAGIYLATRGGSGEGVTQADAAAKGSGGPRPAVPRAAKRKPSQSKRCFAVPHLCGYPDATNTGVPEGVALQPSGSITVTAPGTTVSDVDVSGSIEVLADDVTIEDSRVTLDSGSCGPTDTCGNYEIRIDEGVTGTVIRDTELAAAPGVTCEHDIRNTSTASVRIVRVYMHGCDSNVYGSAKMFDSYGIAKLAISEDHVENVYFDDSRFTAIHDTLFNPIGQTAVIFGDSDGGEDTQNCRNQLTVKDSLLAGGGYTLYPCAHAAQPGSSSLDVEKTHFARCRGKQVYNPDGGTHTCAGGTDANGYYPNSGDYGIAADYFEGTGAWRGNVWDDDLAKVCIDGRTTGRHQPCKG